MGRLTRREFFIASALTAVGFALGMQSDSAADGGSQVDNSGGSIKNVVNLNATTGSVENSNRGSGWEEKANCLGRKIGRRNRASNLGSNGIVNAGEKSGDVAGVANSQRASVVNQNESQVVNPVFAISGRNGWEDRRW